MSNNTTLEGKFAWVRRSVKRAWLFNLRPIEYIWHFELWWKRKTCLHFICSKNFMIHESWLRIRIWDQSRPNMAQRHLRVDFPITCNKNRLFLKNILLYVMSSAWIFWKAIKATIIHRCDRVYWELNNDTIFSFHICIWHGSFAEALKACANETKEKSKAIQILNWTFSISMYILRSWCSNHESTCFLGKQQRQRYIKLASNEHEPSHYLAVHCIGNEWFMRVSIELPRISAVCPMNWIWSNILHCS